MSPPKTKRKSIIGTIVNIRSLGLQAQIDILQAELAPLKEFARFVIASMAKTSNNGYVWTNSTENILKAAEQVLSGKKGEQG